MQFGILLHSTLKIQYVHVVDYYSIAYTLSLWICYGIILVMVF